MHHRQEAAPRTADSCVQPRLLERRSQRARSDERTKQWPHRVPLRYADAERPSSTEVGCLLCLRALRRRRAMIYVRSNGLRSSVSWTEDGGVRSDTAEQYVNVEFPHVSPSGGSPPAYDSLERRDHRWPVTRSGLTEAPNAWWHHSALATELALRDAGQEYIYSISELMRP